MTISKNLISACAAVCLLTAWSGALWGHGGTKRVAEASAGEARIFIADAATGDLVAVDLPTGEVVSRLSTPRFIMSLALSTDEQRLFVMRGRSTDRDLITVVNTGKAEVAGELKPPYIARTIPAATPGPGDENRVVTVGGKDALMMEGTAEFLVMEDTDFTGLTSVGVRKYRLGAPDHYFYLESGDNLYVGHLRKGYVQVLNRESAEEVARITGCPLVHGKAKDEASGRLFYACMRDIMVVGTRGDEMNKVVARIPYPEDQRVGAFYHGPGRILWAYTEGILPIIYRLDAAAEPYSLEVLPLDQSIRQWATEGGEQLLTLTRGGVLEIRDGATGALLHGVQVCGRFEDDYHEHTDKAILPDIKSLRGDAYVSLPHEGRIAVVDLETGKIERYLDTGGEPTRIVLMDVREGAARAAASN
ncbi:MAG: hypothetical protein KJO76_01955 [Gammaproteobacteria bacterium]|nr:hypothetical protein [Gammaproteobacteria bacterium]MBT8444521.1 hypothetical protein [Gammaproteobacteria bacterium]NND36404.1 hypothetical protein [Gammaproteobacteria bacterium]